MRRLVSTVFLGALLASCGGGSTATRSWTVVSNGYCDYPGGTATETWCAPYDKSAEEVRVAAEAYILEDSKQYCSHFTLPSVTVSGPDSRGCTCSGARFTTAVDICPSPGGM
jgi:hypothetical protein